MVGAILLKESNNKGCYEAVVADLFSGIKGIKTLTKSIYEKGAYHNSCIPTLPLFPLLMLMLIELLKLVGPGHPHAVIISLHNVSAINLSSTLPLSYCKVSKYDYELILTTIQLTFLDSAY